uniref:Diguanylate cyclase n=1 Tax=candidate division WOR-3 bacterium TaxID=2052148 RepID=A0A7C4Y636_UNCW3
MNNLVLSIDDDNDILRLISQILNGSGYNVITADKAVDALRILEEKKPDIILLDVNMPDINGIDLLKQIKSRKIFQDIPVIMVTVESDINTLKLAFDAGAVDYITKPIKAVELIVRVSSMLKLKKEMDVRKEREQRLAEITRELAVKNRILKGLSFIDELTGIGNRRLFDMILEKEWKRAKRYLQPISLIIIDIDYFKNFNDTYGHLKGDDCLKTVAKVLSKTIKRPSDIVARYGGEEFAVILPDTNEENAVKLAEDMRIGIENLNITHISSEIKILTISLGVASVIPNQNLEMSFLILLADRALYDAKNNGRNCVKVASLNDIFKTKIG